MFTKEHVCVMGRYMVAFGHTISWEIHTSIDDHPSVWETKPCFFCVTHLSIKHIIVRNLQIIVITVMLSMNTE